MTDITYVSQALKMYN